jgi:putative CocE/NonD family hydrolase
MGASRFALLLAAALLPAASPASAQSERPATFTADRSAFSYTTRTEMIPMRDGVKLLTVIVTPNGLTRAPIILTRTPYNAAMRTRWNKTNLAAALADGDPAGEAVLEDGYIRVYQDVRGQHGSEGDYVMNRPLAGPLNPTGVDHATDTYDTIDWLVKHVPGNNGRVGIIGISYDGFTSLMALVHPHPALKASVPINPMVDGWMGDDWFHYGAFREIGLEYFYDQETPDHVPPWWTSHYDDYSEYLAAGSAGALAKAHGLDQIGFWQKVAAHPAYDAFWQQQAMDRILAREPLTVPTMLVHSLWDQEDMYGATAVYRALAAVPADRANLHLVIGPWYHHQQRQDGSRVGNIAFGSDTSAYFRENILRPFFRRTLYDDPAAPPVAPVTAFVTGTNVWERLQTWPQGCPSGCSIAPQRLYLQHGGGLAETAPAGAPAFTSYVSDPAKPVPFIPRPVHIDTPMVWQTWLTTDQRDVASRTDVVSYATPVLTAPLRIAGVPIANLVAATSGTDGDFVVKLIDEYPAAMGRSPELGGYQLMIGINIFRGRYRESLAEAHPIVPDQPVAYRFDLPAANHVFLPGHRVMVQIQSSLYPLYDRNPQTFVPSIFFAPPDAYRAATIRIDDGGPNAGYVELPVVRG